MGPYRDIEIDPRENRFGQQQDVRQSQPAPTTSHIQRACVPHHRISGAAKTRTASPARQKRVKKLIQQHRGARRLSRHHRDDPHDQRDDEAANHPGRQIIGQRAMPRHKRRSMLGNSCQTLMPQKCEPSVQIGRGNARAHIARRADVARQFRQRARTCATSSMDAW